MGVCSHDDPGYEDECGNCASSSCAGEGKVVTLEQQLLRFPLCRDRFCGQIQERLDAFNINSGDLV